MLIVSQFTLYGDCKKGRRPSFVAAARPETAIPLYEYFIEAAKQQGIKKVATRAVWRRYAGLYPK